MAAAAVAESAAPQTRPELHVSRQSPRGTALLSPYRR